LKLIKYIVFCLAIFLSPYGEEVFSQQLKNIQLQKSRPNQGRNIADERLAVSYYRNGEFEKAAAIFAQIYERNKAHYYYNYYFNCLIKLNNYKEAEKLAKKQNKISGKVRYKVDLAYVYDLEGNKRKAISTLDKITKDIPDNMVQVRELASALQMRGYYGTAVSIYKEAAQNNDGSYEMELANAYQLTGDYDKMFEYYLNHLETNPQDLQLIKNRIQTLLRYDVNDNFNKTLKEELILKTRDFPDNELFAEFLLWYSMQNKDFDMAYIQAAALDRRFGNAEGYLLEVAEISLSNKDYESSAKAYKYLIDNHKNGAFYIESYNGYYEALVEKEIDENNIDIKVWKNLKKTGEKALEKVGVNTQTSDITRLLAYLTAFKLGDYEGAKKLLEPALQIKYSNLEDLSKLKLLMADILVLQDKIWDASLLYSQIEGDMKNETIGHEAKFRNAKLFYYAGEFDWSLTRLDVLKSATSKLISNDAIELSIFIKKILEQDTLGYSLKLFAKADLFAYRNQYDTAKIYLQKILDFPVNETSTEYAYYKLAKVMAQSGDYDKSDSLYAMLISTYPNSVKADNALFEEAEINRLKLNNPDKAIELYLKLLKDYPDSVYSGEARLKYRELKNDSSL